jgi:peptide/nickel transport system substrate-binding protein
MTERNSWERTWRRRFGRRRFVVGGVTSVAGLTALACAGSAAPAPAPVEATKAPTTAPAAAPTTAPSPAAAPKLGGVLKYGVTGETTTMDPHATQSTLLLSQGGGNTYSRLVMPTSGPQRKGDELLIVGDAAESWSQPDDITYLFKMRPGLKFQNVAPVNGREATAQDVAYSFTRQRDLKVTTSFLPVWEKIEAVDKQTLKITLAKPDADFLITLASYANVILAKEAVDIKGDLKEGPTIGSGPWILDKFEPNSVARLKKNPDWYIKGVPYLDALEFVRINDDQVKLAAFRTQELGYGMPSFSRKDIDGLQKQFPQLVVGVNRRMGTGLEMGYDQTKPPFNDKRVRQAFQIAVDRQQIFDTAMDGDGWWTTMIQFPDLSYNLPEDEFKTKWFKRDVAQAKQLLAAAGVQTPLEVEFLHLQFQQNWTAAAELTMAQLKEIGVNGRLKIQDAAAWTVSQTGQGDYQAYHGPLLPPASTNADLYQRFYSGGGRNPSKTKDPTLDKMIDQQAVMSRDPEGRKKLLMDIQRYILDQAYVTAIWGSQTPFVMWPWFKNYRVVGQRSGDNEPLIWVWLDK